MVADGRIFLATPVNPVLLVLPYLYQVARMELLNHGRELCCEAIIWDTDLNFIKTQADRLVPLDQLMEDLNFPATDGVLGGTKGLEVVAERKGDADLNVWKFDKEKALTWLEERVDKVAKVLQRQGIDLTQVQLPPF